MSKISYGNKLSKEEILKLTKKENEKGRFGIFINTDGVTYDLNGKGMAEYLTILGFKVIKYYDSGRNGLVLTEEGIQVSTNGFCSVIKNI